MPAARRATSLGQLPARGDAELLPDEIDARDELGHRMLHLQSRVELDEVIGAVGCQQKLERPGIQVGDHACGARHVGFHGLASRFVECRRR